jgi:hypothetical protein
MEKSIKTFKTSRKGILSSRRVLHSSSILKVFDDEERSEIGKINCQNISEDECSSQSCVEPEDPEKLNKMSHAVHSQVEKVLE